VSIDAGASRESATIQSVGTAATATTLAAPSNPGDTNVKVGSVTGLTVGHTVSIDTGPNLESATITSVGTAGSGGTGIILAAPLAFAHAGGVAVQDLGTGITLASPLTVAHASGVPVQDLGTGITLAAPLTLAHSRGVSVQDLGTGVTFTPALTSAHPLGAAVIVGVTFDSLEGLVAAFSTNAGVASSLNDKLQVAAAATKSTTRDNQLNAFENQLNAQTGKAFTAVQSQILLSLERSLR
jgi:hypothetical protein